MKLKSLALALATCSMVAVSACRSTSAAAAGDAATPSQQATTLRVVNQRFLDMTISVVPRSGAPLRLGNATGNATTTLRIPDHVVFGTTQLRFVADPIGGPGASVSQSILVTAGDQVTLTIPPG